MTKILNLTQHQPTAAQAAEGVFEPQNKADVQSLLTFETLPSREEIIARAEALANIAKAEGAPSAMVGGAPYLMGALECALKRRGIQPLYAFSVRESVEETLPTGEVIKKNVFKHLGFVEV